MRDKTFFACGIRDWLQSFAGYEIEIEQTSIGMRDRGKNQHCGMQEMAWFSRGIRDLYIPIGGPLRAVIIEYYFNFK